MEDLLSLGDLPLNIPKISTSADHPRNRKLRQGNVQVLDNKRINSVVKKEAKDSSKTAV